MCFIMDGGDNKILTNIERDDNKVEIKIEVNIKQSDFQTLHKLFFRELKNILDTIPDNWNIDLQTHFKKYSEEYSIDKWFPNSNKLTTEFKNEILYDIKTHIFKRYEDLNYEKITVEISGRK